MADPAPTAIFDHVYAGGSPELDAQQETFERYLAGFADGGH
jgi:hypothetical protein